MKKIYRIILPMLCSAVALPTLATKANETTVYGGTIENGIPWYDQNGNIVNAHGAGIIYDNGRYWLFGEWKSDSSNAFPGFSCYSSADLAKWRFERVVLPMQASGLMGPERVGERVKVLKNPKTGEYVMFMHSDNLKYKDPYTCYATSKTINVEYTFRGPLMIDGKPMKKWDIGIFQDNDGTAYLLVHHGPVYKLSDDYHSIDRQVAEIKGMGESPAMFHTNGYYFMLSSNLTSWEKNDNMYHWAKNIEGPWHKGGLFCPEGTLTWNSQSSYVLPIINKNDTTFMFMGDRWSYPHQASAATYVWMPIKTNGNKISIPEYWQSWSTKTMAPVATPQLQTLADGKVMKAGDSINVKCQGEPIYIYGKTDKHSGYAKVTIYKGKEAVYSSLLDFYSKNECEGLRMISPEMPAGEYTLSIKCLDDYPVWTDKTKTIYGSDMAKATITRIAEKPLGAVVYEEDTKTKGLKSMSISSYPEMNWILRADGSQYKWVTEKYQWGRTFNVPEGVDVKIDRKMDNGELVETYTFTNTSKKKVKFDDTGIYTPFNDNYPKTNICMTQRCNTHIWTGGTGSYVQAIRMDGKGTQLGLVLTKGSIPSYQTFERSREKGMSNYRGILAMDLPDIELKAGNSYTIQWRIFATRNKDFDSEVLKRGGIVASSPKYVYNVGETATVTFKKGTEQKLIKHKFSKTGKALVEWNGAKVELLGISSPENLIEKRAHFITAHQQMHKAGYPSQEALMIYDNKADTIVWQDHGRNDLSDGRERLGMGCFLAKYTEKHPDENTVKALKRYASFVRNSLQEKDYFTKSSSTKTYAHRGYNYAWVADFYFNMYNLTGEKQYAIDGYGTMRTLFRHYAHKFYCIGIPTINGIKALEKAGLTNERDSLMDDYKKLADTFIRNGLDYPGSEVNYEQSIVAPSVEFLCEMYMLTKDKKYLDGAEVQMPALEAFNGHQPSYHLNDIAIRHWDCYWFGKKRFFGDTMPHYWSTITAAAFHYYALATGKTEFQQRAEEIVRNNLSNFFEDGKASCAYVYTSHVNGEKAAFYDDYANDQDWALYYYLVVNK